MDTSAKILLLGQTKAGKSSFINYFLGKDVAAAGVGKPITQEMTEYELEDGRYPIKIYDTKGIEALGASNQIAEVVEYIKKKNGSDNVFDWFHTIFYCVSMANGRFQEFEAQFIKELRAVLGQHIHIIITHCDVKEESIPDMRNRIISMLGDTKGIEIFEVVSVDKTKRGGKKAAVRRGKEAISERVFDLLLEDIADKVSRDYAKSLHGKLIYVADDTYAGLARMVDENANIKGLIQILKDEDTIMERIDKELQKLEERFYGAQENADNRFKQILHPVLQLYNSYWGIVTDSFVDKADLGFSNAIFDTDFAEWINEIDESEFIKWIMPELHRKGYIDEDGDIIDADDDLSFWDLVSLIKAGAGDFLHIKKNLKKAFRIVYDKFVGLIPSEEEMQQKAYERIVSVVKDYRQSEGSINNSVKNQSLTSSKRGNITVFYDGESPREAARDLMTYIKSLGYKVEIRNADNYYECYPGKVIIVGHHSLAREQLDSVSLKYDNYGMKYGFTNNKCVLRASRSSLGPGKIGRKVFEGHYNSSILRHHELAVKYNVPMSFGARNKTRESQYDLLWLEFISLGLSEFLKNVENADDDIVAQAANDLIQKFKADEEKCFALSDIMNTHYENNESFGMETLRRHLGDDIVFTSVWSDAHNARDLEVGELSEGEVSGNTFTVGKYTIRWTVCLYRDDDEVSYHERVPAEQDVVAKYRKDGLGRSLPEKDIRKVESISAKYGNSSEEWHHICLATQARSMAWSESVNFIGTLKLSDSASDDEEVLFILNEYLGDSFNASYWYKLSPDGTLSEYSEHPYNPESFDESWRD